MRFYLHSVCKELSSCLLFSELREHSVKVRFLLLYALSVTFKQLNYSILSKKRKNWRRFFQFPARSPKTVRVSYTYIYILNRREKRVSFTCTHYSLIFLEKSLTGVSCSSTFLGMFGNAYTSKRSLDSIIHVCGFDSQYQELIFLR